MKTPLSLIFIFSMISTFLFKDYGIGLNLFLFNILLILGLVAFRISLLSNPKWIFYASISLITSFFCYAHGSIFSTIMNVLSLMILGAMSENPHSSFISQTIQSLYSHFGSIIFMIKDAIDKPAKENTAKFKLGIFPIIFSLIIVMMFVGLYMNISPVFKMYMDKLNWSWISFSWISFTMFSFIFLYPFFRHHFIKFFKNKDEATSNELLYQSLQERLLSPFQSILSYTQEIHTSIFLFVLLNIVLFIVNAGDSYYMFSLHSIPENISYSEYLHNGIFTLIVSIIFVISILIFFFRGHTNFSSEGKYVKLLAYAWIVQNIFLVTTNIFKNSLYIDEYGFTYKRVGVYIYLLLCIIGLMFVFYKIYLKKNTLFLFRSNALALYIVLVGFSCVNWNDVITAHNIQRFEKNKKELDVYYLAYDLSNENSVILNELLNKGYVFEDYQIKGIKQKYSQYINELLSKNWRDKTLENASDLKWIQEHKSENKIDTLHINYWSSLNNQLFQYFPVLKHLKIEGTDLDTVYDLSNLDSLHSLELDYGNISMNTEIILPKNLDELTMSNLSLQSGFYFKSENDLDFIKIQNCRISESDLIRLPNMKKLFYTFEYENTRKNFQLFRPDVQIINY